MVTGTHVCGVGSVVGIGAAVSKLAGGWPQSWEVGPLSSPLPASLGFFPPRPHFTQISSFKALSPNTVTVGGSGGGAPTHEFLGLQFSP